MRFNGFAGTSAGAIVAALAAACRPASDPNGRYKEPPVRDMRTILADIQDFRKFLDGHDEISLEALTDFTEKPPKLGEELWQDLGGLQKLGRLRRLYRLWKLYKKWPARLSGYGWFGALCKTLATRKGIYGTDLFMQWLRKELEDTGLGDEAAGGKVTFGSVRKKREVLLKVVAADLARRQERVFSAEHSHDTEVAVGVIASMSIPLIFHPAPEGDSYWVDGGVVSNFPLWAFDEEIKGSPEPKPVVVGFRLTPARNVTSSQPIRSVADYTRALYDTILDGSQSLQTRKSLEQKPETFIPVEIEVPRGISATAFSLSESQREALYKSGYQAAETALKRRAARELLELP